MKIEFCWRLIFNFLNIWGPTQNLGPICSAVLTFINGQTNRQTDKQRIYIDDDEDRNGNGINKGIVSVISSDPECKNDSSD